MRTTAIALCSLNFIVFYRSTVFFFFFHFIITLLNENFGCVNIIIIVANLLRSFFVRIGANKRNKYDLLNE